LYESIHAKDSDTALNWYLGLKKAILSLKAHPKRCPVIRENARLRHLLYGQKPYIYRVIYRINEKHQEVEILHIRHGARKQLKSR